MRDDNFALFCKNLFETLEPPPNKVAIVYKTQDEKLDKIFHVCKKFCECKKVRLERENLKDLDRNTLLIPLVKPYEISDEELKILRDYPLVYITIPNSMDSAAFISPHELKKIGGIVVEEIKKYKKFEIVTYSSLLKVEVLTEPIFDFSYSTTKIANFPAGELYFTSEVYVDGEFTFESTPRKVEWKIRKKRFNKRRVEEIGIGINPYASPKGNWREIEKMIGNIHIGISTSKMAHLDLVNTIPTLYAEGRILLKNGKFLFGCFPEGKRNEFKNYTQR